MATNMELLRSITKRRKIQLRGQKLTEKKAKKIISQIKSLSRTSRPIGLWVDSGGGSTKWALEIYKAIKASKAPVYAYVTRADSAALIVIQACDLRVGKQKSKYELHLPSFSHVLKVWPYMDIERWLENARQLLLVVEPALRQDPRLKEVLTILLNQVSKQGKTRDELLALMRENRSLSADEALDWGLIDVVENIRFSKE